LATSSGTNDDANEPISAGQHSTMNDENDGREFTRRDAARDMTRAAMQAGRSSAARPSASTPLRPPRAVPAIVAIACVAAVGALAARLLTHVGAPAPTAAMTSAGSFSAPITPADEATILAAPQDHLALFRLAAAPKILVLSFPSLHQQALTLDRVGAFVEKAGMPHDRVLSSAELADRLAQVGEDFDTFYYAHDYRAADLARFFAAADAGHVALDADERGLEALLGREAMLQGSNPGAIISVPPLSQHPPIDARARAAILRHEVSHGVYFTDPPYAAYTAHFWADEMTDEERAAFRRMLSDEGYDTSNEDLMRNEMQAYLVHTPDLRYFNPARMRIDAVSLRSRFVAGMPPGWLRDETVR
jgi:hypothetical protein